MCILLEISKNRTTMKRFFVNIGLLFLLVILLSCNKEDSDENPIDVSLETNEWVEIVPQNFTFGRGMHSVGVNDFIYFEADEGTFYNVENDPDSIGFFKLHVPTNEITELNPAEWQLHLNEANSDAIYSGGLSSHQEYNVTSDFWTTTVYNGNYPAGFINCQTSEPVFLNNKIYVTGAFVDCNPSNTVYSDQFWSRDITEDNWEQLPPHPFGHGQSLAFGYQNTIYVFIQDRGDVTYKVTKYDLVSNAWEIISDIPVEMGTVMHQTRYMSKVYFYTFTGSCVSCTDGTRMVYEYDIEQNTWAQIAQSVPEEFNSNGELKSGYWSISANENAVFLFGETWVGDKDYVNGGFIKSLIYKMNL